MPSDLLTKTVHSFLIFPINATCPAQFTLHHFTFVIITEECKRTRYAFTQSSLSSCQFPPVRSKYSPCHPVFKVISLYSSQNHAKFHTHKNSHAPFRFYIIYYLNSCIHDKQVPVCRAWRVFKAADGEEGLQMKRVSANILNKKMWTTDNG